MSSLKTRLFALLKSMILENSEPKAISLGFSIGIFIGFLPIIGIQTIPAFFLASKFHANRIAAMLAVWITNPFTILFIYLFNYWTGSFFFPQDDMTKAAEFREFLINIDFNNFYKAGRKILLPFLVGSFINGLIFSFISYWIILQIAPIIRAWVFRPNLMRYFQQLRKSIVESEVKKNGLRLLLKKWKKWKTPPHK